uniref:Serpentine receptor class gamma n=1 Tax=Meloidogyne incognita TaxID=6306 RepID=A0A914NJX9_MELIC
MGFFLSAPIVFLANTVYLPFVISLVIGIPSVILYSFEVVIIITKWKDYNSSFFQLLIARAILNILNFIISFAKRFAKVGLFTNIYLQLPSWVLATTFFFGYYCVHGENIATTLQLLDRLSSILWPFTYEKAWNRLLPFAILLIFILPLARTIQIFSYDLYARLQADNQTITIAIRNIETLDINPAEDAAYSCVIFMFICLIINIATLLAYKTKVQSQTTKIASNGLQKAIEKRLTLYAFWTFVGQLLFSISTVNKSFSRIVMIYSFQTLIYISVMIVITGYTLLSYDENQNFYLAVANQIFLVSDISTVVLPAWLLLWANGETRKHIFIKINLVKNIFKNGNIVQPTNMYG